MNRRSDQAFIVSLIEDLKAIYRLSAFSANRANSGFSSDRFLQPIFIDINLEVYTLIYQGDLPAMASYSSHKTIACSCSFSGHLLDFLLYIPLLLLRIQLRLHPILLQYAHHPPTIPSSTSLHPPYPLIRFIYLFSSIRS